jgi:crossover junction endodeoxyribonuclease RuvC
MRPAGYSYGCIHTRSNIDAGARLARIYDKLTGLIADEQPELIVIEDVFSLKVFPSSGITLGKVCGVILLAGCQANIPTVEVAVREAKQVLTGNGNADKQQLERSVRRLIGAAEPVRPAHAADALGLALIGLYRQHPAAALGMNANRGQKR